MKRFLDYSLFYNEHSKMSLLVLVYVQTHCDIECVHSFIMCSSNPGTEMLFECEGYSVDDLLC